MKIRLPIGLPNAAETPDAAPAATKSRRCSSVLSGSHNCISHITTVSNNTTRRYGNNRELRS